MNNHFNQKLFFFNKNKMFNFSPNYEFSQLLKLSTYLTIYFCYMYQGSEPLYVISSDAEKYNVSKWMKC